MFDGRGEEGVGKTGEGAGEVELGVRQGWRAGRVVRRKIAACGVEGAKLDGDTCADSDQRGERALCGWS